MAASYITTILVPLLAIYTILAAPLGYRNMHRLRQAGDILAKVRLYRQILVKQAVTSSVVCWLWLFGGIPGKLLGICAPRSGWLSAGSAVAIVGLLLWSAIRLRPKAKEFREKLQHRSGPLLPESLAEMRWFAAISIGGGISEELVYRGFGFYYLSISVPHAGTLEKVLLTSLIFGTGHLYQGRWGVAGTTVSGLMLAGFYLLSGSLLLPMVIHALGNLRAVLVFWPATRSVISSDGGVP